MNTIDRINENLVDPVNPVKRGLLSTPVFQSKIENLKSRIRILVDASNAIFPVTIDPLATSANWTAESSQASAQFGNPVSMADR
jgi:hypothetical protein